MLTQALFRSIAAPVLHLPVVKWGFTVTFQDSHGYPHWSVTSPTKYDSKGEALYWAYATCQKRGFTPQAKGITITTSTSS